MAAGRPPPTAVPRRTPPRTLASPARVGPIVVLRWVGPRCPPKLGLELGDGIRQDWGVPPPHQREPKRPVEGRQVPCPEALGLPLPQPYPRHARAVGDLVG